MKYLKIDEEYLNLLRAKDSRIPFQNYGQYKYKPFIGPLFEKDGLMYVTHLTHYNQEKHSMITQDNRIKHIIRDQFGKETSVINLAGMFPVPSEAITNVKYDELEKVRIFKDERDLFNFTKFLKIQMKSILAINLPEHAKDLYARKEVFKDRDFCVNYKELEGVAQEWQKVKEMNNEHQFVRTRSR